MKIALVCPYDIAYPGGVQNNVLQFAGQAKEMGHDVTVIAPISKKKGYEGVVSAGRPIPMPVEGGTVSRVTFSVWNLLKIRELLKNGGYDVVHVHSPEVLALGPAALYFADPKRSLIVTTFHTNTPHNAFTSAYIGFLRILKLHRLMEKIDLRIAVSEAAKSFISRYSPGRYVVIPNGINTELFSPAAQPMSQYRDGKVNILFVGRLGNHEKRKGLKHLVVAFNNLHSRNPKTRLLVAGPGEPDSETKGILRKVNNQDIVLVGRVSAGALPGYYATAKIFCSPATHGESFGMVLIEAMASGKPVVASDIDGYREVMLKGDTKTVVTKGSTFVRTPVGFLAPPGDEAALAAALELLIRNGKARAEMGRDGRRIVAENYSWKKTAARLLKAYELAMHAKKGINAAAGI